MANKILFKVSDPPQNVQNPFSGRKASHDNPNFDRGEYQEIYKLEEKSECLVDGNNNVQGIKQWPLLLWKNLDIDTPFFKECLIRNLVIGEMSFHFFHNRNDPHSVNHFTMILKRVKVLESQVLLLDISDDTPNNRGPNAETPYIEQLKLSASEITWKYSRANQPREGTKTTVFQIGD